MIPSIAITHSDIGMLLGSGGFCSVYDLAVDFCDRSNSDIWESQSSLYSEDHSSSSTTTNSSLHSGSHASFASGRSSLCITKSVAHTARSALKKLKMDVMACPEQREAAMNDLQKEASILSMLPQHPHIIRLRAVSINFWSMSCASTSSAPPHQEPYLVLEKLERTLDHRLRHWSKNLIRLPRQKSQLIALESDRLVEAGAVGIAQAVKFLHAHRIMFRDLKPSNIGFALDGTVRLFDFGLARPLPEKAYCTTFVGTARYIAPEVVNETGYDQRVDVYSLGMVLWEICALEKPFAKAGTMDQLLGWVSKGKNRPCMRKVASPKLRQLLTSCIHSNPNERPSTRDVFEKLRDLMCN